MSKPVDGGIEFPSEWKRVLGRIEGAHPGPTLLVTGGIHGNEPAGPKAIGRFVEQVEPYREDLRGRIIALAGNLQALARGERYIERDLNRQWTRNVMDAIRGGRLEGTCIPEYREQIELYRVIHEILDPLEGDAYFVDLHTSSASGLPFLTVGDTLRNRAFAHRFRLPMILGLEEQVDGSLLEYINNLGYVTMGVEGGRHDDPASVDHIEAALWLALVAARMLAPRGVDEVARSRSLMGAVTRGMPRVIEVRYRHAIRPESRFRMEPGFQNFTPVAAGTVLGNDREGEVVAREDGLVLLPLYQGQGNDGFFLAREVQRFWLKMSSLLRRSGLARLLRILPGVAAHPDREATLVVDTRIARLYPMEILHLLGYRKLRERGNVLLVSRRRFDLSGPRDR